MAELSEAARDARNAYYSEWRARNRERIREKNRLYWERRAERMAAQEARERTEPTATEGMHNV